MKIKEVLDKSTQFFREKGIDTPRLDAEMLLANALGVQRIDLYLKFDQPLQESELNVCRAAVKRRAEGEPVAYITGTRDFYGHEFKVNSAVLIPRPETEHLVEQALIWLQANHLVNRDIELLDLGCGSGCIGISLLKALPNATGFFVDQSIDALNVAKENAKKAWSLRAICFLPFCGSTKALGCPKI